MDKDKVLAAISAYNDACYAAFNAMLERIANEAIDAKGEVEEQAELAASVVVEHGADDFGDEEDIVRDITFRVNERA